MPASTDQNTPLSEARKIFVRRTPSGELIAAGTSEAPNSAFPSDLSGGHQAEGGAAESDGASAFSLADYAARRRAAIASGDVTGGMGAPLSTIGGSDEGLNLARSDDDPTLHPGLALPKPNIIMEGALPTMQAINEKARRRVGKPAGTCSSCGGGKSTAKSALESLLNEESFAPRDSMPSTNEISGDSLDSERSSLKGDLPTHGYYGFPILEPAQTLRASIGDPADLGPRDQAPANHDLTKLHFQQADRVLFVDASFPHRWLEEIPMPPADWKKYYWPSGWDGGNGDYVPDEDRGKTVLVYRPGLAGEPGYWESWTLDSLIEYLLDENEGESRGLIAVFKFIGGDPLGVIGGHGGYMSVPDYLCDVLHLLVARLRSGYYNDDESRTQAEELVVDLWEVFTLEQRKNCWGSGWIADVMREIHGIRRLVVDEGTNEQFDQLRWPTPSVDRPYKREFTPETRAYKMGDVFRSGVLLPVLEKECYESGVDLKEIHIVLYDCTEKLDGESEEERADRLETALEQAKMLLLQCCVILTWEWKEEVECDMTKAWGGMSSPGEQGVSAVGLFPPSDEVRTWGEPGEGLDWEGKGVVGKAEQEGDRIALLDGNTPKGRSGPSGHKQVIVSGTTIVHEIGHNAGLEHDDRETSEIMNDGAEVGTGQSKDARYYEFTGSDCEKLRDYARDYEGE